ncbi:MAG: hypothetical protein H8E01_00230, partial [Chloroflexi bacterium]|nr:hypothetical protein [Chloroflexota bacterium]
MKRSSQLMYLALAIGVALLLIGMVMAPLTSGTAPAPSPEQMVQRAWQRAQEAGVYGFSTEIVQTTYPAPALVNVGRSSRKETLHIEGQTNLPERSLLMTLWKDGGSLLNPRDGVEMRVEGDRAYGRAIGGTWEEVDDFSGAFAPGNDLMAYLAGAKNVRELGTETRALPPGPPPNPSTGSGQAPGTGEKNSPPLGSGEGLGVGAVTFTRYGFQVDGPAFAEYLRDQLEHHLREQGELPLGLSLDASNQFRAMTGQAEVWIDGNGLPLRLTVHLDYPEQRNGERIEADIKTDFSHFAPMMEARSPVTRLAGALGLPRAPRDWQRVGRQTALVTGMLGLLLLLLVYRRSKKVYAAIVGLVILSMVITPLLQSHQVYAFFQRQQAQRVEYEQRQKEQEAARQLEEEFLISDWDPHRDPLPALSSVEGSVTSDQLSVISDQSSPQSEIRNPQFTIPNIQYPTSAPLSATDDEDNDGLTKAQEQHPLVDTYPTDPDSDDDGLTDGQEVLRLSTDPKTEDSDGDGISDYVEVRGFEYPLGSSEWWYTDPNNPDTNNDGLIDTVECPERVRVCKDQDDPNDGIQEDECITEDTDPCGDTDGDGVPDPFDYDNDGDEVSDRVDLSPNRSMDRTGHRYDGDNPFTSDQPFELKVQNLNTAYPVFVDFQLRPVVTDHLSYALNVLDWPSGDTEGQIQRVKDTTFATTDNLDAKDTVNPRSQNGDMRLIPMLEITMPYNVQNPSGNLPVEDGAPAIDKTTPITAWLDAGKLQSYGISVRKKDNDGNLLAYVPLNLVKGETGGGKEAFSARMLYWPSESTWGNNHQVRVVWVVQMLTDWCDDEGFQPSDQAKDNAEQYGKEFKTWCADHRTPDQVQIVHTYYDDWYLTGLSVREDHGLDVAIAYENPTTDEEDPQTDDWLWQLARGLGVTFAAGRDEDGDGQRDITVSEIKRRFDITSTVPISPTRWNIPQNALLVETFSYTHQDHIAHIMMTETERILEQFAPETSPTLLFAREEHYRSASLDMGSWVGDGLTVDLAADSFQEETIASLNWAPYRFREGAWEPYPIREYWDQLEVELKDLFARLFPDDSEDINLGKMVVARSYYVSLLQGLAAQVQSGAEVLWTPESGQGDSDADLVNTVAELIGGTGIQPGGGGIVWTVVNEVTDASLKHLRKSGGFFIPKYISKVTHAGDIDIVSMDEEVLSAIIYQKRDGFWKSLGQGIKKYVVSDWAKLFKGGAKKTVGAGVALAGAVTAVGLTVYAASTSTGMDVAVNVVNGLNLIMAIHGAVQTATKVIEAVQKAGTFAKAAADGFAKATKEIAKAFKSAAVIGLVIAVTATWGSFIAEMVLTKTDFGSLAFNAALATAIASTVVLVIMFAIAAIPVVGQIISAVITAIDAVINLLCGAFDLEKRFKFSVGLEFQSDLDNGKLSEEFRDQFKDHGITLSYDLTITTEQAETQWRIKDDGANRTYIVIKDSGELKIYEEQKWAQYFCKGISGWLAEGIKWTIYSATIMVDMSDENRLQIKNFDQDLVTREKGLSVGNTMVYSASIVNTINLVGIPFDWKAASYWHQYSDNTLRSSTFQYKWQTAKDDFHEDLPRKKMMAEWQPTNGGRPFFIAKSIASNGFPLDEAGINRPVRSMYVSEGYAIPVQECWVVPNPFTCPFFPGVPYVCLVPVCYIRTEKATNHIEMGKNLRFDVFPETLDGFYELTLKQGGLALAWGQDGDVVFPPLKDADGDGLLNKAAGGSDPDDSLWDSDYDGLSDLYEFQNGTDPLNADSDFDGYHSDGLSDYDEAVLDTNPNRLDTDSDGLLDGEELDGWEYVYGFADDGAPLRTWVTSDPTEADKDGDTLTDFLEKTYGFHPRVFSDPTILTFESEVREVAAPKLLLRFEEFKEEEGVTTFSDTSGYDNHGTCSGDSCPTAGVHGRHGYAIQFNDGSEYLTAPGEGIDEAQELTVAAWVQLHSLPSRWMRFVTLRNNKALLAYGSGELSFRVMIGGQSQYVELPDAFQTGTFYHVAGTYDGSQLRLYLDGQEVASLSVTGQVGIGDGVLLSIGNASEFLNGVLDEVVIFDRALSAAEINDLVEGRYNPNDLLVKREDVLDYQASVKNELFNRYAQGLLSTDFPAAVSSAVPPEDFILYPLEEQMMSGTVEVDAVAPTGVYSLTQVAGALITDWGELAGGAQVWLPFEDPSDSNTFEDRSGSQPPHHGTCVGASCPPGRQQGKYGNALVLNGNAYVEALVDVSETAFAVSLWFKTTCADCGIFSVVKGDQHDRDIYLSSGDVWGRVYKEESIHTSGLDYADGQWHHLVHTFGGGAGGQKLYVDGLMVASGAKSACDWQSQNGVRIGFSASGATRHFTGLIDDLRIFDEGLGPEEVQALFGQPVFDMKFDTSNIVGSGMYWPDDSTFENDCRCVSPTCPNSVSGISGQAVQFSGRDKIQLTPDPSLDVSDGRFTISAWVYPEDYPAGDARNDAWQGILGLNGDHPDGYPSLRRDGDTNAVSFGFGTGSDWEEDYFGQLTPNRWNHVVVTFGPTYDQNGGFVSNVATYYINGEYDDQWSVGTEKPQPSANGFFIGRSNSKFDIYIYAVGITKTGNGRALCLAFEGEEIWRKEPIQINQPEAVWGVDQWRTFYESGELMLWEDEGGAVCGSGPDDNDYTLFWKVLQSDDPAHYTKGFSFSGSSADSEGNIYFAYFNHSIPFHGKMDEVRVYKRVLDPGEVEELYWAGTTSLHLPFDEAPGSRTFDNAADPSGQSDGSCLDPACPTAGVGGRMNQAAWFEAAENDRLSIANGPVNRLVNDFTVAAWIRPDTVSGVQRIVSTAGTNSNNGWGFGTYDANLRFTTYGVKDYDATGIGLRPGRWTHVAAVMDAQNRVAFYVDGQLATTLAHTAPAVADTDDLLLIGATTALGSASPIEKFGGLIDDVHVFHQALSTDQVQRLYSEAPRFQMHFDEALSATQFADNSGNGNDGACSGDTCPNAGLKGRIGPAVEFDGVDDVVTVPDDSDLDLTALTVGAWIMPTRLQPGTQILVRKGSSSSGDNYELYLQGDKVHYRVGWGNCKAWPRYGVSAGSVIPNTWNHAMMTFEGNELTLYLNGSFDSKWEPTSLDDSVCQNDEPLRIGWGHVGTGFAGRIDEVTIYDHALTAREVRDIFQYQAKWVEEWQSHDVTVDADEPTSELRSDGPYLAQQDVVMHIEAHDPTSSVSLVKLGVQGPSQGSYTWAGAPRCMDATATSDAAWCPTFVPSGEGRYRFKTSAIDQVGNQELPPSGPVTIYVDGTPPVVTSDLADGDLVNPVPHLSLEKSWTVHLSGTVSDPQLPGGYDASGVVTDSVKVTLFAADGTIGGEGTQAATVNGTQWAVDYLFDDAEPSGQYTLRVEATDQVGNQTQVPADTDLVTFYIDATAPAANLDLAGLPTILTSAVTLEGDATEHPVPVVVTWTTGDDGDQVGLAIECDGLTLYLAEPGGFDAQTAYTWPGVFVAQTTYTWDGDVHRGLNCQVNVTGGVVSGAVEVCGSEVANWDGGTGVSFTADSQSCGASLSVAGLEKVEVAFRASLAGSPFYNGTPPDGQLLHLPFEDTRTSSDTLTFRDISAQAHVGKCEGDSCPAVGAPGHTGSAARFDGVDDYIKIDPAGDLRLTDQGTLAAWVYPTGVGSGGKAGGIVINKEGEYEVARYADGTIRWAFANDDPGWQWIDTGYVAPLNQWTHIVVVYNAGVVQTYANGTLVHTYNGSGNIRPAGYNDFRIGGRQYTSQYFDGLIDEVRVFDRVLSADEIRSLYLGSGPVLALPFDEPWATDSATVLDDSGWEHDGTLNTVDAFNKAVPGKVGAYALQFDGVDDYVSVMQSHDLDRYDTVSIAAWIYPTGTGSGGYYGGTLFYKDDEFQIVRAQDGRILSKFNNDDPGYSYVDTGYTAPLNQWTHVAVVYDAGVVQTFANGRLVHTYEGAGSIPYHKKLRIGAVSPLSHCFDGLMDDVHIYPRSLSELEVQALYDSAWREATLIDVGSGVDRKGWSFQVPEGLEGDYQIDLRGYDVGGHSGINQGVWRGEVDTLAPRLTLTRAELDASTYRYRVEAQDFNLTEEGFNSPCGAGVVSGREYYRSEWYTGLTDLPRLYGLTAECDVPMGAFQGELGAYDTPGLARRVVITGALAYVADRGGGLQIVDLSNLTNPKWMGEFRQPGYVYVYGVDIATGGEPRTPTTTPTPTQTPTPTPTNTATAT